MTVQEAAIEEDVPVQQTGVPLEPELVWREGGGGRRGRQRQQQPLHEKTDEGVPEVPNHPSRHGWGFRSKNFLMPRAGQMPVG